MFLLLSMLQVMYIHLECNAARNWCHHFLCSYYSYVLCMFSRKSTNFPPVLCERGNGMRQKKLWIFSSFPLSKNAVFLQHEGEVSKAPKLPFFFLSKTNAFSNMPGRAGRVSKGYCYRLVTKRFWNKEIPDHMVPDMLVSVFFLPPFYSTQTFQLPLALGSFNASKMKQLILCVLPLPLSSLHWPPSYWKWSCWTLETLAPSCQRPSRPPTSVTSWEQCCS